MCASRRDVFQFGIGEFKCAAVSDGVSSYATPQLLFADGDDDIIKQRLKTDDLLHHVVPCDNTCLVVIGEGNITLMDTGFGSLSAGLPGAEDTGRLITNLGELGIGPDDVDAVILTHYHGDHIGGCADNGGKPVFGKAEYYFSEADWECLLESGLTSSKRLTSMQDRVILMNSDMDIRPGIRTLHAPGHTPGHMIVSVQSRQETLLCVGDLIAHDLHLEFPSWGMSHEWDSSLAVSTRNRVLEEATSNRTLIHAYHLKFPSVGYVTADGSGFRWQSLDN